MLINRWGERLCALLFGILFFSTTAFAIDRLVFLDVGQGDAILLQCGDCHLLVDAGNLATAAQLQNKLSKYDVQHLNYLVITHPHLDHFGGVFAFPVDFRIDQVVDNGAISPDWVYFDEYLKWRSGYRYSPLHRGQVLHCG